MWFGTKDGLNRFDGYSFKVFRNEPNDKNSLGGSFIHCLSQDSRGLIWIGTERGLYYYNEAHENFRLIKNTNNNEIRSIHVDHDQNVWFISNQTLYRIDATSKRLTIYPPDRYLFATSICETKDGILWFSDINGNIARYNKQRNSFTSFSLFDHSPRPSSKWIEKVIATEDGNILAATPGQGVKHFDTKKLVYKDLLSHDEDGTGIYARNILQVGTDEYWFATESGLYIYSLKSGLKTNIRRSGNNPYSLSDNALYALYKDKDGGIWVSTYFGGVNYYSKQSNFFEKTFHNPEENSITGNAIREIVPDGKGNLWIGTEDAGINKLNLATGRFNNYKPDGLKTSLSTSNIHGLLVDGTELWIGTFEHGLDIMDLNTEKVVRHYNLGPATHDLKSNFIFNIYKTRANQILVATTRGVYSYNRARKNFDAVTYIPSHIFCTSIMEDSKGNIWVGTIRDGLYCYNMKNGKSVRFTSGRYKDGSLVDNRITALLEDKEEKIWVATEAGLSRFDSQTSTFTNYTMKDGLASNVIYDLLEDSVGNLWLSSSKGLMRFNKKSNGVMTFTSADGLITDQFNYHSSYQDPSGKMYFGGFGGVIHFKPNTLRFTPKDLSVFITGIQLNNEDLEIGVASSPLKTSVILTKEIELNYDQSTFSIDFAALSYDSPEMIEYAFKIDGLDKQWTYLKRNRRAYFTNLSPGRYLFRVKASNRTGIWNTRERLLYINIAPPYWASPLAYMIYSLVALATVVFILQTYHRRSEVRNRHKMQIFEVEKEKEVYRAKIQFFTNIAHEIRTPLTLIKGPMEKIISKASEVPGIEKNIKVMQKNTDRLLELTNQLLDFRKTETEGFSLSFVKTDINETLLDIFSGFQSIAEQCSIRYELKLPSKSIYAYIDLEAFHKITTNLIDNAIKYGVSSVVIELSEPDEKEEFIQIIVKNDGSLITEDLKERIFEPFFRARETDIKPGTGLGLSLSRSLAELHSGSLTVENNNKQINIFKLKLPVHQSIEFNFRNS